MIMGSGLGPFALFEDILESLLSALDDFHTNGPYFLMEVLIPEAIIKGYTLMKKCSWFEGRSLFLSRSQLIHSDSDSGLCVECGMWDHLPSMPLMSSARDVMLRLSNTKHTCAARHQFNLAYRCTGPMFPKGCIEIESSVLDIGNHQGYLQNYLQTLPITKKTCRSCKAVELDGILYQTGDLILPSPNASDIECGWIKIILCSEETCLFVLECITAEFNSKVGINQLPQDASGQLTCVSAMGLKYAQHQPLYDFKGKLSFTVKGKII